MRIRRGAQEWRTWGYLAVAHVRANRAEPLVDALARELRSRRPESADGERCSREDVAR